MEAPENIYLSDFTDTTEAVFYVKKDKTKKTDIEYTRKDAFIEKAIGWIDYNNRNGGCNFDGWKKDFKKYMEEQK